MPEREIVVKAGGGFTVYGGQVLVPGDVHAYRVRLMTPWELTGCSFCVTARRADGAVVTDNGTVSGREATYLLANNLYSVPGQVCLRLTILSPDGGVLTDKELVLDVAEPFSPPDVTGDDRVPVLTRLISDATVAAAGANSAAAEAERQAGHAAEAAASVSDALSDMAQSEQARDAAEEARAQAEIAREEAETARAQAEAAREAAETARQETEVTRGEQEAERTMAEAERAAAETAREQAESARDAAEFVRAAQELARQEAEAARAAAEQARQAAEEARLLAESLRVQAETARNETFDAYLAAIDGALAEGPVQAVNGKTGLVWLTKADLGLPEEPVVVGPACTQAGPILWFHTGGIPQPPGPDAPVDAQLLLGEVTGETPIVAVIDGEQHGVENASADGLPAGRAYDFKIQ